MAWIRVFEESEAHAELSKVYQRIKSKRGKLSNIMMVQSLNPLAMQAHLDLYLSLMFRATGIKREVKEMIAIVVSKINGCDYCIQHHAEALNYYWQHSTRVKKFLKSFTAVGLSDELIKLLEYAEKLTQTPDEIKESDVEKLKSKRYTDEEILNLNMIVSYFNFVNRIANGLGVEFSSDEISGYKY
jgi:uncharacterized peroxidase-related enzyme